MDERPTVRAPAPSEGPPEQRATLPWIPPRPLLEHAGQDDDEAARATERPPAPVARHRAASRGLFGWAAVAAVSFAVGLTAAAVLAPRISSARDTPAVASATPPSGDDAERSGGDAERSGAATAAGDAPATGEQRKGPPARAATADADEAEGGAPADPAGPPAPGRATPEADEDSGPPDVQRTAAPEGARSSGASAPEPRGEPEREPKEQALVERSVRRLHRILPELRAAQVQRVIARQRPRMQRCYDRALRRVGRPQPAELDMVLAVERDGSVGAVRLQGDELGPLHACLRQLASRLQFPASRSGARVPLPLRFAPGG